MEAEVSTMSNVVSDVVTGGHRADILVPESATSEASATAVIHDRGRGPEIRGTRITVYSILDYLTAGWPAERIADQLGISPQQVQAAVAYIAEQGAAVMANYARILERAEGGNPPELQARTDAGHERFLALVARIRSLPESDPEQRRLKIAEMIRLHRGGR
jgi:uncharacterized protein (DUF433 family)